MTRRRETLNTIAVLLVMSLLLVAGAARAQEEEKAEPKKAVSKEAQQIEATLKSIQWNRGPTKVTVGDQGEMQIPEGYVFTGPAGTRRMLELMKNPTDGSELGLLTTLRMDWFVIFEYRPSGYVKDADKEKLDAKAILDTIRQGTEKSNEERRRRGWPAISIVGWHTAPFYDAASKNLQWCIQGTSDGRPIVNYNTRILGRGGVMSANLLVAPAKLDQVVPVVKELLVKSYGFQAGKRYAEFKSGDKLAEYGLAALVAGGAIGVAAKLGFLTKFWKIIVAGIVALGAGIKALFTRKKPAGSPPAAPPSAGA